MSCSFDQDLMNSSKYQPPCYALTHRIGKTWFLSLRKSARDNRHINKLLGHTIATVKNENVLNVPESTEEGVASLCGTWWEMEGAYQCLHE